MDSRAYSNRLILDTLALKKNYLTLQAYVHPAETMCVVKANAYGLGAVEITRNLIEAGAKKFFVASLKEAIELREKIGYNFEVFVLDGFEENAWDLFEKYGISPVINSRDEVLFLNKKHTNNQKPIRAMLHYDTGLTRLGLSDNDISFLHENPQYFEGLDIAYIISHLACAGQKHDHNKIQALKLQKLQKMWPQFKYSLLASSGLNLGDQFLFDGVRIGMGLYLPIPGLDLNITQTFKLEGKIIQIRKEPANVPIGYDCSYVTTRDSLIGVVSIGYADGYMRQCSNMTSAFYKGYTVPVLGKISMDLTTIDLTDVPKDLLARGEWVEYCGPNVPLHSLPVTPREFVTRLSERCQRLYEPGSLLTETPCSA